MPGAHRRFKTSAYSFLMTAGNRPSGRRWNIELTNELLTPPQTTWQDCLSLVWHRPLRWADGAAAWGTVPGACPSFPLLLRWTLRSSQRPILCLPHSVHMWIYLTRFKPQVQGRRIRRPLSIVDDLSPNNPWKSAITPRSIWPILRPITGMWDPMPCCVVERPKTTQIESSQRTIKPPTAQKIKQPKWWLKL